MTVALKPTLHIQKRSDECWDVYSNADPGSYASRRILASFVLDVDGEWLLFLNNRGGGYSRVTISELAAAFDRFLPTVIQT